MRCRFLRCKTGYFSNNVQGWVPLGGYPPILPFRPICFDGRPNTLLMNRWKWKKKWKLFRIIKKIFFFSFYSVTNDLVFLPLLRLFELKSLLNPLINFDSGMRFNDNKNEIFSLWLNPEASTKVKVDCESIVLNPFRSIFWQIFLSSWNLHLEEEEKSFEASLSYWWIIEEAPFCRYFDRNDIHWPRMNRKTGEIIFFSLPRRDENRSNSIKS